MSFGKSSLKVVGLVVFAATAISAQEPAVAPPNEAEVLFVRRVSPLLRDKCVACHGQNTEVAGELDLRTREGWLRGGESGSPSMTLDDVEKSPALLAVSRKHDDWPAMPPKEADSLNAEQIGWLRAWIQGGAPWPTPRRVSEIQQAHAELWEKEDGVAVPTVAGLSAEWSNRKYKPEALWAYRPVIKPVVPDLIRDSDRGVSGTVHPIDSLLAVRRPPGLNTAAPADRLTLLRRASFDLTGLPPTPEETTAFLDDPREDELAFRDVVERLLASPHYGERMAQHWLDVTRYADSSGFANDYERGNAWRYRDYVVRSFNADKPFDQFIREQIAGDELDPTDPEMLVATGFLRMGPWELTGMEVAKIARQRFLDDVTNSVGETFLGQSLQCARCHDHKFDPIPTHDYYAIQAVFATTQLAERDAPFLPVENLHGFDERRYLEQRGEEYRRTLIRLDEQLLQSAQAWFKEQGKDPKRWNDIVAQVSQNGARGRSRPNSDVFGAARGRLLRDGVPESDFPPRFVGFSPADYGNERVARKGLERLAWELERYEPYALSVYNGRTPDAKSVNAPRRVPENRLQVGDLERTCVLVGGNPFGDGPAVQPGTLSVVSLSSSHEGASEASTSELGESELGESELGESIEGRRKVLADWIARADNPLTTRVIVNRLWMWHFGRPLAGNPNNFGTTGKRPTHPELLDWLAATFVEDGWSWKTMHRRIMSSAAYRQASRHGAPDEWSKLDPLGESYSMFSPRRLSAEELRDAMLCATGELNRELGGIPNRPEIHPEVALQPRQVMGTFAAAWVANPLPHQRHRRSLYALRLRGQPDPAQEVFNAPSADFSCERRDVSTITPQVFSLFNSHTSWQRALVLAHRALRDTPSDADAVRRIFTWTMSRPPTPEELALCLSHWKRGEAHPEPVAASRPVMEVQRHAVEENTGEKFTFLERLHANADFVPDLPCEAITDKLTGLAHVCLVVLNSHEFIYVY